MTGAARIDRFELATSWHQNLTNNGFQDYTMLLTFIDTVIRLSEVANLRIDDVDLE